MFNGLEHVCWRFPHAITVKFAGIHTAVKLNRVTLQSVSRGPAGHLAPIMA